MGLSSDYGLVRRIVSSPQELSFAGISFLTLQAVLEVVIVCLAGFFVAKSQLLGTTGQRMLSQLNVELFTPCLVFTKLAPSLSVDKVLDIFIIPVFYAVSTATSYFFSRVMSRLMVLNVAESDFVTAMAVFGNSNSLPVSLTMTLAYSLPDLLWDRMEDDTPDKVASRGMLYLLIFQQLGQILRWSWGYNKLLRKRTPQELDDAITSGEVRPLGVDMERQHSGTDRDEGSIENVSPASTLAADFPTMAPPSDSDDSSLVQKPGHEVHGNIIKRKWHTFINWKPVASFFAFMNPPLYSMLVSVLIASVGSLQKLFFQEDSFVRNTLTKSISNLGSVSIPLILIVLGSNLYPSADIPPASLHYKRIVVASLMARMILPSLVMLPLIALCVKFINTSILDDPIFLIVAFILTVSPPAIQLSQITQLNDIYQKEMAGVLFWGYVILTLPTTIFIVATSLEVLKWSL
ncbi:hypothetical protein C7M61_004141 [Candidozyma pseudohaemuli]|uniref:Transporter n=1 Tax=Candidozyma pseudohaemuli TaxID=418784 RepID=A0A2P7YK20_9ASCO|nr:hypothetical protein C7M61_004141 [[Candida] pseudohaemulonii]PSK36317.1 hypothetical protein C7M61_004141 [[Candida] pseudohaemulonii]